VRDAVEIDETGESSAARVAAFGRWLAQERDLRGLARAAVVARTKLPPSLVEALESGDEARMPPSAYVVGYLRSYAAAVGLDADEVVLRWQETAVAPPSPAVPGSRARTAGVLAAAILALAVAGAAAWALFAGG
jgi:cytoskeletal protein RodZ